MSTTTEPATTGRYVDATDAKQRALVDTPDGPGVLTYVPIPGGTRRGPARSSRPRKLCVRIDGRHGYYDADQVTTTWPRPGDRVLVVGPSGQQLTGDFLTSDESTVSVMSDRTSKLHRLPRSIVERVEVRS